MIELMIIVSYREETVSVIFGILMYRRQSVFVYLLINGVNIYVCNILRTF